MPYAIEEAAKMSSSTGTAFRVVVSSSATGCATSSTAIAITSLGSLHGGDVLLEHRRREGDGVETCFAM